MCDSYIFGSMCVEYSNRLCVKAIYLLLYEAIYNLCNIFKEIKSIVCKFKIKQRITRNTWAINALHWNFFYVRKPHHLTLMAWK